MSKPIIVDIRPAKRRFGIKPRKQWQFQIKGGNGEPIDPRDTYANTGDILMVLSALRSRPMRVRVHYPDQVKEIDL